MSIEKFRRKVYAPSIETDALDAGTQTIGTTEIADLGVTTAKLAADAVTNAKLADNAVQAENIKDGEVGSGELASGAVVEAKLGTGAVTAGKIGTGAVTPTKTADIPVLYNLGAPVVEDVDRIVTSANMKVGTYTIAAQPDIPRNITATRTAVGAADTGGTITIDGTDASDAVIQEVINVGADGVTVAGTLAFKTVTAVTGAGWVIGEGNDTITVGVGSLLGLPVIPPATADVLLGVLGTAITAHNPAVAVGISGCTVNMSAGTYDGSKKAMVFVQN